jgi:Fe-S cluster assembly protein SufD
MTVATQSPKTDIEIALARQFEARQGQLPGNDWAQGLRAAAMNDFVRLGLPHRRIEAWKYTDLRSLLRSALEPAAGNKSPADRELYQALGGELHGFSAHHIVFVDGRYDEKNTFIISDEAGFIDMQPLADVLDHPPAWFKSSFGDVLDRKSDESDDPLLALNTAYMSDGAVIEIGKGAKLKRPIHLIYVSTEPTGKAITERNFIHVEAGADITILESYVHLRAPDVQRNAATELRLEPGARVSHIKFQHEGAEAAHLSSWRVRLGERADYRAFQFALGAKLSRSNIDVVFAGEGANADISGVALLWDQQHADTTLAVDHLAPGCVSRELYKYVLDDRARGVFQGKLLVRPGAIKTDAKQMARGLLLSDEAEFDAKPELEIYADDVACGHGATSGQLEDDQLFYLRQRGIPEAQARSLLVLAFIGEALERIANDDIRTALQHAAESWLGAEGRS